MRLQSADFFIYDFHLAVRPLVEQGLLRPEFTFLSRPNAYHRKHERREAIRSENLQIQPLSRQLLRGPRPRNYFWYYYSQALVPGSPDQRRWHLQLPFICRPQESQLVLHLDEPGSPIPVTPSALLWSFGWSSALHFSVPGEWNLEELQHLTSSLHGDQRVRAVEPFLLDGRPATLSRVFLRMSNGLKDAVFTTREIGDIMSFSRRWVICIVPTRPHSLEALPDDVLTSLCSALKGKQMSRREMQARQFLITPLRFEGDFAVTDFKIGTVLFLDGDQARQQAIASRLCLGSNIRDCSLATEALRLLSERARELTSPFSKVTALANSLSGILEQLPRRYMNPFCSHLFNQNALLRQLLEA